MEINLLREAALPDATARPQRSKNQGSSQESGGTCVFVNATSPGMLLAATALIPLPRLSQDCIYAFIVQVLGWRNRSGRTIGKTLAGRSGLVSGGVCNREDADVDNVA